MKTKLLLSIILSTLLLLIVHKASAQETERTFTISPPSIEVKLDPGKNAEGVIKIINDSNAPLVFKTSVQDFIVKDDLGTPDILPSDTLSKKYSGASWVALYPEVVTVNPHTKSELNYYIQAPGDARPGGHYAAVMYTPTNTVNVPGNGTAVNTSVGTLLYITVNGPVTIQAKISKFLTKGIWDFGPVKISSQITNMSDVHVRPIGTITLTNILGGVSDVKKLNEVNIFPGGISRNYETSIGKTFMLGLYKVHLNATYGPQSLPLVATTSFVVFPWKLAAFLILLALVLGFGYRTWKKGSRHPHTPDSTPEQPYTPPTV